MTEGTAGETTVLFVDDEQDVLNAHVEALADEYTVLTAGDGEGTLAVLDESVDLVFLDRMMPGMQGKEVLEEIRERGFDVPVCMVTAVEPDVNIIEMPFDDYLTKPADRQTLQAKVERLTAEEGYVEVTRELSRLNRKKESLEAAGIDRQSNKEYRDLLDRIDELQSERDEGWLTVQEF